MSCNILLLTHGWSLMVLLHV